MLREYDLSDIVTEKLTNKPNIHFTSDSIGEPFKIAYEKFEVYTGHIRETKEIM